MYDYKSAPHPLFVDAPRKLGIEQENKIKQKPNPLIRECFFMKRNVANVNLLAHC